MPRINFKKILLIIFFFIIVILAGYLIYKTFFASLTKQNLNEISSKDKKTVEQNGQLPNIKEGTGIITNNETNPSRLETTEKPILDQNIVRNDKIGTSKTTNSVKPTSTSDGSNIQFYNADDDKFYRVDENGEVTPLSNKKFYNVDNIVWSPKKDEAILEYPDNRKIIYNFKTDEQINLPSHWQNFSFSQTGDQIVFKSIGVDVDNRWLAIMNSDGTKAQKIEKIGINADKIIPSWSPNNQVVALMAEGATFNQKNIYFIGLHGENFRMLTTEGRGFEPIWSPKGDKLLYSVYSSNEKYLPRLWLVDAQGDKIGQDNTPIDLHTWAHKCTFVDNDTAYCAVPKKLEEGAGMFPYLSLGVTDDLYKIDIKYGTKTLVTKDIDYNMSNLIVTKDKNYLYFTDATNHLRRIELQK